MGRSPNRPAEENFSGRSPVDRGKQGTKRSVVTDGTGIPVALVAAGANRHDSPLFESTMRQIPDMTGPLPERPCVHLACPARLAVVSSAACTTTKSATQPTPAATTSSPSTPQATHTVPHPAGPATEGVRPAEPQAGGADLPRPGRSGCRHRGTRRVRRASGHSDGDGRCGPTSNATTSCSAGS